eukprot:TRINITY_DN107278_c0_g1_i1.p2 TRINITY_DN107278_c0_g1~~TRINITY_DN107278_c0_g1_i1.p2  ORF type:complete len:110 (+),score=19.30 TRINITY_DN107278_c0_g1_i1:265-594(+)
MLSELAELERKVGVLPLVELQWNNTMSQKKPKHPIAGAPTERFRLWRSSTSTTQQVWLYDSPRLTSWQLLIHTQILQLLHPAVHLQVIGCVASPSVLRGHLSKDMQSTF